MAAYRVTADGHEMASYTEFMDAGHHGVRARVNGSTEELSGRAGSAHGLALEYAEELAKYVFGKPAPHVKVLREDGTVAAEWKRESERQ